MAGLYFEDMTPGRVVDAEWRRTVTEADSTQFCGITMNPSRLHLDAEHMAGSEFGRTITNSLFTLGLMIGMSVHNLTFGTAIADLGITEARFPAPVFAGDTLRTLTTIVAVRESRSRPDAGIASFRHEMRNQRGVVVATCDRTTLVLRRPPYAGDVLVA